MADDEEHKVSTNASRPLSTDNKFNGGRMTEPGTGIGTDSDSTMKMVTDQTPAVETKTEPKPGSSQTQNALHTDTQVPKASNKTGVYTMELTPIEKNAKRDYIRIMMIMPCPQHSYSWVQLKKISQEVYQAYRKTIGIWPFLAGRFRIVKGDNGGEPKHVLAYARPLRESLVRSQVSVLEPTTGGVAPPFLDIYGLPSSQYASTLAALRDHDPETTTPFPPIALKMALVKGVLVLSFAFSNIIFDGEFITNFFREFLGFSILVSSKAQARLNFERGMPKITTLGIDEKYEFPCFNWYKTPELGEPTQQVELGFKVFSISARNVHDLFSNLRSVALRVKSRHSPMMQDSIFALFWVLILRARTEYGLLEHLDWVRANIMVPGHLATKERHDNDRYYYGNSTVTAVASCKVTELVGPTDEWPYFDRPASAKFGRLGHAGCLIRKARREINKGYMSRLYGLKQATSPAEDQQAQDRALRPLAANVVFEDWTNYGADLECHFPYLEEGRQPRFVPCMKGLKEGTVIILPRKDEEFGEHEWNVCVCLGKTALERVEEFLKNEGWIG
ncbi:hypothetical protein ACHAPU_004552 [Fusarium lateritium]